MLVKIWLFAFLFWIGKRGTNNNRSKQEGLVGTLQKKKPSYNRVSPAACAVGQWQHWFDSFWNHNGSAVHDRSDFHAICISRWVTDYCVVRHSSAHKASVCHRMSCGHLYRFVGQVQFEPLRLQFANFIINYVLATIDRTFYGESTSKMDIVNEDIRAIHAPPVILISDRFLSYRTLDDRNSLSSFFILCFTLDFERMVHKCFFFFPSVEEHITSSFRGK